MKPPISADTIRAMFSARLSEMYRSEMPRYRAMIELVARVNRETLARRQELGNPLPNETERARLDVERHGAVRVGAPAELAMLRRLFAIMGMTPVDYYDLSTAGLPVHSTAFRPMEEESLQRNPFRIFVSLLRLELIDDLELRREIAAILARRKIVTPRCRELLDLFDDAGGFDESEARAFVSEAIETFRWRPKATVSNEVYRKLHAAHPLIADIACFKGPHINHLTVSALDIDAVQRALAAHNLDPKEVVEGPPARLCPILLRQTSFKAQAEPISFDQGDGVMAAAAHAARFGEIEQRGAALTAKGRALYDRLLSAASADLHGDASRSTGARYAQELARRFKTFPDDWGALWSEGLAFFRYRPTAKGLNRSDASKAPVSIKGLVEAGYLEIEPIEYQDFLPVSAAGIFRSNLTEAVGIKSLERANRRAFEDALGANVVEPSSLYEAAEARALCASLDALGLPRELPR